MSQRIHGTSNSTNFDTINCDSYATKLHKTATNPSRRSIKSRESSQSRTRPAPCPGKIIPTINLPSVASINSRSMMPRQSNTSEEIEDLPVSNIIRKEIYDAACVEVTVKTHGVSQNPRMKNRIRPTATTSNELPWGKLLKNQSSIENVTSQTSQFKEFDPLRTLHFLAKELQTRINDSAPSDSSLHQMVTDMQLALSRIPPEVASIILLQQGSSVSTKKSNPSLKSTKRLTNDFNFNEKMEPEKLITSSPSVPKPLGVERSVQTLKGINYVETEKLQKHLEESTEKIEIFCKQMELVCTRLKNEKEEVESLLQKERETVKELRKRLEELDQQKIEGMDMIAQLGIEKDELHLEIKKLKSHIENETGPATETLKEQVDKLREQKAESDNVILELKHQLTMMTMNKEKYAAILSARDKQISEIRREMNQFEELVKEQLLELQENPPSSNPSTASLATAHRGISSTLLQRKIMAQNQLAGEHGDIVVRNSSSTLNNILLMKESSSLKEVPSGDSSGTSAVLKEMQKNGTIEKIDRIKDGHKKSLKGKTCTNKLSNFLDVTASSRTQTDMRDLFQQIKNDALGLHLPVTSSSETSPNQVDSDLG